LGGWGPRGVGTEQTQRTAWGGGGLAVHMVPS
jgi:hypothetical protein